MFILAFFLSSTIGLLAWKAGALTPSGGVVAAITGGVIFGAGGLRWAVLLLVFFVSSSVLSRLFSQRKQVAAEKFSKGATRDWGQVLANGGPGMAMAAALLFLPDQSWPWFAYAGTLAAVNADTWGTEVGVLSKHAPRLITTGVRVENGASGGVTLLGFAASLGGAALIGGIGGLFSEGFLPLFLAATLGGFAGALFDSFLGATVQALYFCPADKKETEQHPVHVCGTPTAYLRGWRWLNNDWVNASAAVIGGLAAVGIGLII